MKGKDITIVTCDDMTTYVDNLPETISKLRYDHLCRQSTRNHKQTTRTKRRGRDFDHYNKNLMLIALH